VPVLERIGWLQLMLSGEQNQPLAVQLIPLVTLWPLLDHVQHTVSPSVMFSVFGTKARPPCPTVTSHTRGGNPSHGVPRERGVGVGLTVASDEPINAKIVTKAVMNKSKGTPVRNRRQTSLLFGFVLTRNYRSTALSPFLAQPVDEFQLLLRRSNGSTSEIRSTPR
jgi:hypothetical protein